MAERRDHWSSRAGFILAATGSAVGLGNLWKFPYITWENNGGAFVTDDCPQEFWPELTGGNWQSGLSPDGTMQMVWEPDDAVFALRHGADIDVNCERPRSTDTRLRLWSAGALRLAGRVAGLSTPRHLPEAGLLVMGRADR